MFQQTAKLASKRAMAALATGVVSSSVVTWEHQHDKEHRHGADREEEDLGEQENELVLHDKGARRAPLHLSPPSASSLSGFSLIPSSELMTAMMMLAHQANTSKCDNATTSEPSSLFAKGLSSILSRMQQAQTKDSSLESKYKINSKKPIGEGAFGQVFLATHKITGEQVAVKKIWKEFTKNEDCQREMSALLHIKEHGGHPHICSLHENFDEPQHFALVLDLINGGELFDRLVENGAYSELDASRLMREVVSAMNFLHGIGLVHGDVSEKSGIFSV